VIPEGALTEHRADRKQ